MAAVFHGMLYFTFCRTSLTFKALAELQRNVASNIYFCLNKAKRLCLSHCSQLLDDVECATFNLFVTQISRKFFVISFH